MRVIFNIHSKRAAENAGWRAREVQVTEKKEADLEEALKSTILKDGSSMYDYIIEDSQLRSGWTLFVNGAKMSGGSCLRTKIKDNVQIHLMYTPPKLA